jgi:hypothetical protein
LFDIAAIWWQTVMVPSRCGLGGVRGLACATEEPRKGAAFMSLANHLDELQRKHGEIERQIDEALTHPSVDDLEIVSLKRRKLALKDEIEKLRHTTH